mmetsp:Transcript_16153/g.43911  ORF Transcript_16153/g.43911 Transcript_16153/m.43911 type:complete len:114 (+) Transcript_16153:1565-1906(+)
MRSQATVARPLSELCLVAVTLLRKTKKHPETSSRSALQTQDARVSTVTVARQREGRCWVVVSQKKNDITVSLQLRNWKRVIWTSQHAVRTQIVLDLTGRAALLLEVQCLAAVQ